MYPMEGTPGFEKLNPEEKRIFLELMRHVENGESNFTSRLWDTLGFCNDDQKKKLTDAFPVHFQMILALSLILKECEKERETHDERFKHSDPSPPECAESPDSD